MYINSMKKLITLCLLVTAGVSACKKDEKKEKIDTEYPEINVTSVSSFPKQCSIVKRGEKFVFRAQLSDTAQLGSVSIDIHHNFDQHSHSTDVETCTPDPIKTPLKPFLLIQSYPIPADLKTFEVQQEISVPSEIDPGDYHFLIRLTDKQGWQTIKGLSIKVK